MEQVTVERELALAAWVPAHLAVDRSHIAGLFANARRCDLAGNLNRDYKPVMSAYRVIEDHRRHRQHLLTLSFNTYMRATVTRPVLKAGRAASRGVAISCK